MEKDKVKNKWRQKKRWIIPLVLTGVMEKSLAMAFMYFVAKLTNDVVAGNKEFFLKRLIFIFPILMMQMVFLYLKSLLCVKCKVDCGLFYRKLIYSSILDQSNQDQIKKASVLNLYNTQIEQLQEYVVKRTEIGISVITFMLAVIYFVTINLRLFIVSVILIPFSSYLYQLWNQPLQKKGKEIIEAKERINFDLKQMLDGFYIMKAYLFEKKIKELLFSDIEYLKKQEKEYDDRDVILGRIKIFLRYIPQLVIPLYGGCLCFQGKLSIGDLIAANSIIYYIILPIESLLDIYKSRKLVQPVLEEIEKLTDIRLNITENEAIFAEEKGSYMVDMQNISFSYPDSKMILKNIKLRILKGKHIILVGESGCGKTTIAKILCGFETEFYGSVRLDGIDIRQELIKRNPSFREKITYIPQDPYIFSGSIKENICMGKSVSKESIWRVIQLVELTEVVNALPNGLSTRIGKTGVLLSGGQIKKIAIARALMCDVECYIFDEPFSAFDEGNAKKIQKNLSRALRNKTVIIITHQRLEFWDGIDAIYHIKEGAIRNEAAIIS